MSRHYRLVYGKSGLDVTVSHYRLSLHLIFAFLFIFSIFWLILNKDLNYVKDFFNFKKKRIIFLILIFFIFIQISLGAFVSGLDAGRIYQTWPLMGETFFPNDITTYKLINFFDFNNHSLVQFYHRIFAYLIIVYTFLLAFYLLRIEKTNLYKPLLSIIFILGLQISLGILNTNKWIKYLSCLSSSNWKRLFSFSSLYLYYSYINN